MNQIKKAITNGFIILSKVINPIITKVIVAKAKNIFDMLVFGINDSFSITVFIFLQISHRLPLNTTH